MEGADAAPCLLERLSEAMLQSSYDRFGGLSKLTKGWTGVYMADRGGRMRARTAMLEIAWLLFFLGCALLFAFGSAGSPCFFVIFVGSVSQAPRGFAEVGDIPT